MINTILKKSKQLIINKTLHSSILNISKKNYNSFIGKYLLLIC